MKASLVAAVLALALVGGGCADDQQRLIDTGQKQGGFAQVQSVLMSAALAQQTMQATGGAYTADLNALQQQGGLRVPAGVTLRIARADATGYCIEASQSDVPTAYHLASDGGAPAEGPC